MVSMEVDATAAEDRAQAPAGSGDEVSEFGYSVSLEHFAGPLDLLLYLVRRAEVDIADIPIADIADQFVATVETWEAFDLDVAGDFILMAATLLEIKARLVAPVLDESEEIDEEEDLIDPRADLIRQLLAYRRIKEGVQELERLERERACCHHRRWQEAVPEDPDAEEGIDLDNADPMALFDAWDGVLKAIAGHRPRTVLYDDIPIEERIQQLERTMREAREAQLIWLLERAPTTIQRCGVVVAVLEGIRQRVVEAQQYEQYGPVYLRYRDEEDRRREPPGPPPEEDDEPRGKRRRRRSPLVTFRVEVGSETEPSQEVIEEVEDLLAVETDDQRFLRELNEQIGIDELLDRSADLDAHLEAHVRRRVTGDDDTTATGDGASEGATLAEMEAAAVSDDASVAGEPPSGLREIIEEDAPEDDGFDDDEDEFDEDDEDDEFDDEDDEDDEDEFDEEDEDEDEEDAGDESGGSGGASDPDRAPPGG